MKMWKGILSVFLSVLIALSTLAAVFSLFLRATVLSENFYLSIIATPTYVSKVEDAIITEFRMESSYSGIPEDVFAAALDETELHTMLRDHIRTVVLYLNGMGEYAEPEYPTEKIKKPMYAFLESYTKKNGSVPTPEQYAAVDGVVSDSADIIRKHVCLIDLNLVIGRDIFTGTLALLQRISGALFLSPAVFVIAAFGLLLLYRKNMQLFLRGITLGIWFAGTVILVPSLVLAATGLTGRLAIVTPYLKYFVDSVLQRTNRFFLIFGLVLFLLSSIILFIQGFMRQKKVGGEERYRHFAIKKQ